MILLKLALVAVSVLFASLASRRFGHSVGGAIAGMPMIAGPIMGFVLLQQSAASAQAIALAALVCLPCTILHLTGFAWCASRVTWPWALLAANVAYLLASAALSQLHLPVAVVCGLALLSPAVGLAVMRRRGRVRLGAPAGITIEARAGAPSKIHIPRVELVCRIAAAVAMAYVLMRGAGVLPATVSGLLLAMPIIGNVLPCFTLARHGARATAALLTGLMRGLFGFAAFFVALQVGLGALPPGQAYLLAWVGAAVAAALTRGGWMVARRFARA